MVGCCRRCKVDLMHGSTTRAEEDGRCAETRHENRYGWSRCMVAEHLPVADFAYGLTDRRLPHACRRRYINVFCTSSVPKESRILCSSMSNTKRCLVLELERSLIANVYRLHTASAARCDGSIFQHNVLGLRYAQVYQLKSPYV
jgi:hypothetical protein